MLITHKFIISGTTKKKCYKISLIPEHSKWYLYLHLNTFSSFKPSFIYRTAKSIQPSQVSVKLIEYLIHSGNSPSLCQVIDWVNSVPSIALRRESCRPRSFFYFAMTDYMSHGWRLLSYHFMNNLNMYINYTNRETLTYGCMVGRGLTLTSSG